MTKSRIARYFLERTAEQYGIAINYHCKPVKGDWNGSGMHANFSNSLLRESGNRLDYERVCEAFRPLTKEHIAVYGHDDNELRLTGLHETQSIHEFSYGISDRGASIRASPSPPSRPAGRAGSKTAAPILRPILIR